MPQFRVQYPLDAFDGGLNNKYDSNILADNESPDCKNVVFDDRGGVRTRYGYRAIGSGSIGSFAGDGLFTYRFSDDTEQMLGWWNGTMYKWSGTTFVTVPSAQSVFTAGTRVDMFVYQDLAFFGNGFSIPYKFNGTDFTRHGVYPPNSAPGAVTAAAGSVPAGNVSYKVTYENSYSVESDVNTAVSITVAASSSVSLTSIPLAPQSYGVAARVLYRADANTSGQYKRVTRLENNTATVFTDDVSSASLTVTAPTDQGVPPLWKYGRAHQERAFLVDNAEKNFVYYTELTNPFVVQAENFLRIGDGDGERIYGIGVHANNIYVGKQSSVHLIYMQDTDPENWVLIKSLSKYGFVGHHAAADFGRQRMFLGQRNGVVTGFYALAGTETSPDITNLPVTGIYSESKSDRIEPNVLAFPIALSEKAAGIEYKNKLWFAVPINSSSSRNDIVYQYDFQRRHKADHDGSWVPFSGMSLAAFTVFNGILYAQASTAVGLVYQMDVEDLYTDNGSAIDSYYWTKEFQGHEAHWKNWKDFRFGNFIVETLGAWYMNFRYRIDSDKGPGTQVQANLNPGGTIWGAFIWGSALWGGGVNRKNIRIELGTSAGEKIQFRFDNQNTAGQSFHVLPQGSFFYNLKGYR